MNSALGILATIAGLAALGWSVRLLVRGPRRLLAIPAAYLGVVAITWVAMTARTDGYRPDPVPDEYVSTRPAEGPGDDYVTSKVCRSCHPGEHHSWHASYHRTMTQVATKESVKGDFASGFSGELPGIQVHFEQDDDGYWVTYAVPEPTGLGYARIQKRRIVMTTGSHHYQVYWTDGPWVADEKPGDRSVWMAPFVYLFDEEQWIPRNASFLTPPSDKASPHRWNNSCIRCHSTHGVAKTNPEDLFHDSRATELGISCEACHGPGKVHIEANRNPLRRYDLHRSGNGDPTIVNPARLDHRRSTEACGQCHSVFSAKDEEAIRRWSEQGLDYRPGDVLADSYTVYDPGNPDMDMVKERLPGFFTERFWPDGMNRVAGREYHGLLNTPCFERGEMSCLSCHKLHKENGDPRTDLDWANDQLRQGMRGNTACIQCHESFSDTDTLTAHTHHGASSSGSNCYNCHMPHTTYGLLKGIRSHQIDSPSVNAHLKTSRPNACNLCHLDKTLAWTAETLKSWFGQASPPLNTDQQTISAGLLHLLTGDAGQRALIASAMGRRDSQEISGTEWMPPFLAQLHLDPYPAVQIIANKSLRSIEGYSDLKRYPETRAAGSRGYEIWTGTRIARRNDPALLLDGDGKLRAAKMRQLLERRDNRRVNLKE